MPTLKAGYSMRDNCIETVCPGGFLTWFFSGRAVPKGQSLCKNGVICPAVIYRRAFYINFPPI